MNTNAMYRVIEVAKALGVSKVTVYKKMDMLKKEMKNHIHIRSNITYIDSAGIDILRGALNIPTPAVGVAPDKGSTDAEKATVLEDEVRALDIALVQAYDSHTSDMLQHLETLSHALKVKKEENERKEQQLRMLQRLVKWNQSSQSFVEKIRGLMHQMIE